MIRKEKLKWYEKEFEDISKELKNKDMLSHYEFLRIRNFKLRNLSAETEESVNDITKEAFKLAKDDKIEESIKELLKFNGVGIPIASTILAMKYPDKFAIIDRRVINALGRTEWLKDYLSNPATYKSYLVLLRENSKVSGKKLRDYERELFEK
jgi:thermostable 8-oxoguanine DNA glycosylase